MPPVEIRPSDSLLAKRLFIDVPFRLHSHDPQWTPPLRMAAYDRLSRRHPAAMHQEWALWTAHQDGRVVGRVAACRDELFDQRQGEAWAWVGFFESVQDRDVAARLFDVAFDWSRRRGARVAVGPANFTTNDELGLLIDGFDTPAVVMTLENPRYYQELWEEAGWEQVMDLYGWQFLEPSTNLSERQVRLLSRLRERAKVTVRDMRMDDYDAEVGRFFELYNRIWQQNWGFVPMPEPEIRHLAKQLKPLLNPRWAFAVEKEGEPVAVCLTIPDVNHLVRQVRNGRLVPFHWYRLLTEAKKLKHVRVLALGILPSVEASGLGPILYSEVVNRLREDGAITAEASWTLATNHKINKQLQDLGAQLYKTWRLYRHPL